MAQLQKQMVRHWHAESAESCVAALESSESGLSTAEVNRRQHHFGLNVLPEKGPTPLWKIVLRQFVSPLIYILVAAAVVSAMIGDLKDAIFIGVVLLLNTIIGAYQEWQAEQCSHALKKLLSMHAHVAAMYVPFLQDLLITKPVDLWLWGVAIAISVTIVPAIDLHKWWWSRRTQKQVICNS